MIVPYWGEFLVSPIPLELSLDVCSHACIYCFSRLNQPDRTVDVEALMRQIADYPDRRAWHAQLLQDGYPVVISNRSDPFSRNNYRKMLPVLRVLHDLGIPMSFQTKGGLGIDEALEFLRPAVWYISISTLDAELSARMEPGAPPPAERLALIRRLTQAGHHVVVGFNPCVKEWQPDPEPLLRSVRRAGATGVWIELLHFNYRQVARLPPSTVDALGEDLIARARRRRPAPGDFDHFMETRRLAQSLGMEVYSMGQPNRSGFWDPFEYVYPRLFPTMQGFVNYCHDTGARVLSFEEFLSVVGPDLPDGRLPIDSYLGATAHQLFRTQRIPPQMTFSELLSIIWQDPRVKQCPARMYAFSYLGEDLEDSDGWRMYVDQHELPLLVFTPSGDQTRYYSMPDLSMPDLRGYGAYEGEIAALAGAGG